MGCHLVHYTKWKVILWMLNIGCIRINILILECVVGKQTQIYVCTQFILEDLLALLYMNEVISIGKYTGAYILAYILPTVHVKYS